MASVLVAVLVAFGLLSLAIVVQAIRAHRDDQGLDRFSASVARERERRDAAGRDAAARARVAGADVSPQARVTAWDDTFI